jgi:ketosteroid isomerase-like protein
MTSLGTTDLEVVTELIEKFAAGDPEEALKLVHPECTWTPTVWSGATTLRGREAVGEWLSQFGPGIENLRIEIAEMVDGDGWIVVLGTVFDTRGGGSMAVRVGWNFAVEDGMMLEGRSYTSWDDARAAAGLGPDGRPQPDHDRDDLS